MRLSSSVMRSLAALLLILVLAPDASADDTRAKLGPLVRDRAQRVDGWSEVIVRATPGSTLSDLRSVIEQAGGRLGRALPMIDARVAYMPNTALATLAGHAVVQQISLDRNVMATMERTGTAIGATAIRQALGYDGTGVGVAVIDSGVTPWHDDLAGGDWQRVDMFVDFVGGRATAYDDYGHGTHVAGIIAGNGADSSGARAGIAPGARLIVLKTLDASGNGRISNVIAALDYIVANKDALNIRVVNMSVASGVYESYQTDPLTLATKRVVDAGIVVVAAAGNAGRKLDGRTQYGGITAPANAPWVLTVGASSHSGTIGHADDTIAAFSSRGPAVVDYLAKPDVVSPGVGIESLSDPTSAFYTTKAAYLLNGTVPTGYLPYLSLSGTSMAAPVVSGTVALMLQANPTLTPNAVKAIVQYTARRYRGYDALTQGAGFVNAEGAVSLARHFAAPAGTAYPAADGWSGQLIWANRRLRGGLLMPGGNAWTQGVEWGAATTPTGQPITWGLICSATTCESETAWEPWGARCADEGCSTTTWGSRPAPNVVWGTLCGGADCQQTWTVAAAGTVLVTSDEDTVVWGSSDEDTVVWGSTDEDTVVWGSTDADTVVWGSSDEDTVVWGSSCGSACEPVIWSAH